MIMLVLATFAGGGKGLAGDESVSAEVSTPGASTPADAAGAETAPSPDSLMSREDWKRRISEARRRADQARLDWKLQAPLRAAIPPDPPEKIASQRVLNDDTLQPGDIVSTDKGLLQFRGWSGVDGQAAQFVPVVPR
ncbi:hypothetical protein NLM33_17820 [Bradyrhizobium sp. CCGUVB1N3]|uniref:hypothetical protein n=1 Tax=Bradyrhizobium sp. CCGUVB1N3 TaxID=2949629 RepID=UPI0020B1C245|nr:hypothetical protein [Bradyrhizobium sp. CCGUVB1N3]MCP3472175.1 hypothetical protein [Bradyrhizobium sp. CCGUVB1N3]